LNPLKNMQHICLEPDFAEINAVAIIGTWLDGGRRALIPLA